MFDPIAYQDSLLVAAEESNQKAQEAISRHLAQGGEVTLTGTVAGPYTTHTSYFLSDGSTHTLVHPSKLIWSM